MKRITTLVILGGVASCALAHDATSDFRKFYSKMLPRIERAMDTKDVNFFKTISTPDFTDTEGGHTMTAEQSMAQMKTMFDMATAIHCSFHLDSCSVKGNVAIAHTSGRSMMTMKPQGGKSHHMSMTMWMTEKWIRTGKTWKIRSIEESKPGKMTMDGKPVDPSKMGGG